MTVGDPAVSTLGSSAQFLGPLHHCLERTAVVVRSKFLPIAALFASGAHFW